MNVANNLLYGFSLPRLDPRPAERFASESMAVPTEKPLMSYDANPNEVASVWALSAPERYEYLVNKVADWEEVWSVASEDSGWALLGDDRGGEACPIWPAKAFAEACCVDDWADRVPKPIGLSEWRERWLPGLAADQRKIAVFPLPSDAGMIVDPLRFSDDLIEALEGYE
ncbi:DUF2750 domain-containing protein [Roseimaritima sediminicola]|uniref:DUF2750 domain-containing protein n=1 Tax=Roseimaritima sediminicola TaxID=2662066 RepID=UPI0012983E30|nr:DUF2750 domain-containing protein [Roseimaritima sediminicola]